MLKTNTTPTTEDVALKYKNLWRVEQIFRDMKSTLDPRPRLERLFMFMAGGSLYLFYSVFCFLTIRVSFSQFTSSFPG